RCAPPGALVGRLGEPGPRGSGGAQYPLPLRDRLLRPTPPRRDGSPPTGDDPPGRAPPAPPLPDDHGADAPARRPGPADQPAVGRLRRAAGPGPVALPVRPVGPAGARAGRRPDRLVHVAPDP